MGDVWPTELRVSKDRQNLQVTFHDGASFDISAELMRVLSPSPKCRPQAGKDHRSGKRNVAIISMTLGVHAVRVGFDDMHDRNFHLTICASGENAVRIAPTR